MVFGDDWPAGAQGDVVLQGVTDNLGNTFAVSKLMTSKFPLVVILAELSAQLRERSMVLNLGWVPRDQNEEADALTNGDFASFSQGLRVEVDVVNVRWRILPRMLEVASDIYEKVRTKPWGTLGTPCSWLLTCMRWTGGLFSVAVLGPA